MHNDNKKAASSELGGSLNFHNPIFSTPRSLPQVGFLKPIGNLAMKVIENVAYLNSSDDGRMKDGE